MGDALDIAREIAAKSLADIRIAKHALNTIEEMSHRDGYRFEQNMTTMPVKPRMRRKQCRTSSKNKNLNLEAIIHNIATARSH
tara:strand:+ start:450 stop:698 length:249 start_codon:yes stop_codon:yes gene_type:complete